VNVTTKSDCRRLAPASLGGGLQPVQKPVASPLIFLFQFIRSSKLGSI